LDTRSAFRFDGHGRRPSVDPCQVYEEWDDIDRLQALEELIHDALEEWGYDDVQVVEGDVDGAPAEYDSNIIYLDMDDEAFEDASDAMAIAYHETMHAILDQTGVDIEGLEEELEAGFLGSRAADEALEGCECGEPVESNGGGNAPPFPFRCDMADGRPSRFPDAAGT
jgi:hypothetical protein